MKMRYFFLFCYFIVSPVFAIYDLVSIDITPSPEGTKFCFFLDNEQEMYLALIAENNPAVFFINEEQALTPWQPDTLPPAFLVGNKIRPTCFPSFPDEALQNVKLFAGAGANFDDVLDNQKYTPFFNGFPTLTKDEKKWTVLVYIVGSDLERTVRQGGSVTKGYASKDILEMLAGTRQSHNNDVNVVISTGGSARAGWKTVKRALIRDGQQYVLEDLGRQNMSEPQTLSDFVIFAQKEFPAQHYALILWNHGGGTQGFGQDSSSSGHKKMMSFTELHQAYQTIREQIGSPLDIVVYDACLMASIEVAEITATVANAMAASAELEPGHGIDYAHLLSNVGQTPPADGLDFGKVVKTGYIKHAENEGTFEKSQITYSVFDLTQLPSFTETFSLFADEFYQLLQEKLHLNYQTLSRGIIRAPGYPLVQTGQLSSLRSATDTKHIRVDFYNLLQTVGPDFDEFSQQTSDLLKILDRMIVDYEANDRVQEINPQAGRISIDINITNTTHLSALSEAHTLFNQGLIYYDERRRADGFIPKGELICPKGLTCAFAQWLELEAEDILGIEAYYGQKKSDISTIYLIDPAFYQYQELTETLELSVDGHQACQYQLCVSESQCEDITLTQQGNQLLADISLNDSPAMLSFCNNDDKWLVCGVAQQIDGVWGRDDVLYSEDSIIPNTLLMQASETEQRQGNALTVDDPALVILKKSCDEEKAAIWAMYYSVNQRRQIEVLCDSGDCICQPDDAEPGCEEIGFRAGVYLAK
jgi:hypothetical protein